MTIFCIKKVGMIMRKNSIKNTRINGEVQRELSNIIRELKDPRVGIMTTVTGVEVAPDLKTCKAYISVLGDEQAKADTMAGVAMVVIGIALGGKFGLCTIFTIIISGPVIQFTASKTKKVLNI